MGLPSGLAAHHFFFGIEQGGVRHDYPTFIDYIVGRIPPSMSITAEMLIAKHTMFPYYNATFEAERGQALFRRMRAPGGAIKSTLSYAITFGSNLRFCPECLGQMIKDFGEAYWHREHQIPAVLMCPTHGCVLRHSSAKVIPASMTYTAATEASCGIDCKPVRSDLGNVVSRDLLELARRLTPILESSESFDRLAWHKEVMGKLANEDVAVGGRPWNRRISKERSKNLFDEKMGHLGQVWPDLFRPTAMRHWKAAMDANGGVPIDPAFRALLSMAFTGERTKVSLIDDGDQPCRNPIMNHHGRRTAKFVRRTDACSGSTNTYRCDCGYSYTIKYRLDGTKDVPRFKSGGFTIKALLGFAGRCGITTTEIKNVIGIETSTFHRVRAKEGIDPWWMGDASDPMAVRSDGDVTDAVPPSPPISAIVPSSGQKWKEVRHGDRRYSERIVPDELTDPEWDLLSPVVSEAAGSWRPKAGDLRSLMNRILHVLCVDCPWIAVRREFHSKGRQVYYGYQRLRCSRHWTEIEALLLPIWLERQARGQVYRLTFRRGETTRRAGKDGDRSSSGRQRTHGQDAGQRSCEEC